MVVIKTIVHFLHTENYEEGKKNHKFSNVGMVQIDLLGKVGLKEVEVTTGVGLEKCFDRMAKVDLGLELKEGNEEKEGSGQKGEEKKRSPVGSRVRKDSE